MNSRPIYATLILIVFGLCVWVFFSQRPVEKIKVLLVKNKALHFYGSRDLRKLYSFVQNNPEVAVQNLSDLPYVERAFLSRSLSGQSKIEVSLQQPIFALTSDEIYKLVNAKGEVFSEVPQYKVPNVPILTGPSFLVKENRMQAVEVLGQMPTSGVVSKESLSEVLFDGDLYFIFSGVDGKVYLGREDIKKKVNRLARVVKYLRYHGMSTTKIDARFKDKVIVSLNKQG